MKQRGGARTGAGRKKGQINGISKEIISKAKEGGELPHEFLLRIARDEIGTVLLAYNMFGEPIYGKPDLKSRQKAAEAAAPYYAPRLAQIEAKIESDNVHHVICDKPLTLEEFNAKFGVSVESTAETEDIS
jgi:hypothetical protein